MSCGADCRCGRGVLSSALGGLRRGPGALGLVAEDRLHLGALEGPVASCDLRLELTRCPAGVADEDPQTVHGIVAAKRSEEHTSELQSPCNLVCRLLLEKKKTTECETECDSYIA